MKSWLLVSTAIGLLACSTPANAQKTDPFQYQARIADEVKIYFSDCKAIFNSGGGDPDGLSACLSHQKFFGAAYYDALEGDQNEKFEVAVMFQEGDTSGIKYNATMACGWWIEMVDTGGRLPLNIFDNALADACRQSQDAVDAAMAIKAEEDRVSNLTY